MNRQVCVMASRRKYSREYKWEAAQLVQAGDVAMSQVARELGINAEAAKGIGK